MSEEFFSVYEFAYCMLVLRFHFVLHIIHMYGVTCERRSEIGIRWEAKDLDRTVHDQQFITSIYDLTEYEVHNNMPNPIRFHHKF